MNGVGTKVFTGSDGELRELAQVLSGGGLVAIPTETVYGLAANALDEVACRRIFEVKGRPLIDPLIVHVTGLEHAAKLAEINAAAAKLMERYWPGPLTIVLKKHAILPDIISAGLPTVALRCPRHPLARKLLFACGLPLAAPSANRFGYVSPTCAEHVLTGLGGRIGYILDGGPCSIGLESTIIGMANPENPVLFRPGAISREELSDALSVQVVLPTPHKDHSPAAAPGMLKRHYSPRTPLVLFDDPSQPPAGADIAGGAVVFFARPSGAIPAWASGREIFWLSDSGDVSDAAQNMFALLRLLDGRDYPCVFFQRAPSLGGICEAINDRLGRAAAQAE
jgi:L-threonylcarbamoyladenylate synthase